MQPLQLHAAGKWPGCTGINVFLCFSEFQDVQRTFGAGSSKRPEISLDNRSLILLPRFHWECVDGYIGRIISYISSQVPPQKKTLPKAAHSRSLSVEVHRSYWIPEDIGDAPDASDAPDAPDLEGPQCIGFTAPTEDDWFVAQIPAVTEEDHSDEDSEGPVIVKNVDSDSCAGSLIQESIITEIRV